MPRKPPNLFCCTLLASFLPLSAYPEPPLRDPAVPSYSPSTAPIANLPSVELQIHSGSNRSRQKAVLSLGLVDHPMADKILLTLLRQLEDGKLPPFLWLEVLEAAATKTDPEVSSRLTQIRRQNHEDPVRNYLECLEGGSAYRGEDIFLEEAACATCHSFRGKGGHIGPDLTGIGGTLERIYILQSIVDPNAVTAPGFQNVLLHLQDGSDLSGILKSEDSESLKICVPPHGTVHTVPVETVLSRTPLPSAMPPGLAEVLGRRKLRDLIEFLAAPR
ncbi:MAG: hypothetical protein RLZZ253_360 [Verrucomicrobiota bacterium]